MREFFTLFTLPRYIDRDRLNLREVQNRITGLHVIACRHIIDLVSHDEFSKLLRSYPVNELFGFSVVLATLDNTRCFNTEAHAVFRIGDRDRIALLLNIESIHIIENAGSALTRSDRHGSARTALGVHLHIGVHRFLELECFIFSHHFYERINTFGSGA